MAISDALFARNSIREFTRLSGEIGEIQARISSGTNDERVSNDPARAIELSALRDIRSQMTSQADLASKASTRLALVDRSLQGVSTTLIRLQQIALMAANDTLTSSAQAALRVEVEELTHEIAAAANASDSDGRSLFSGTASGPAYIGSGMTLRYAGNGAQPVSRIGEGTEIATGFSGLGIFGDADEGIFGTVNDLLASLTEPMLSARSSAAAENSARLDVFKGRDAARADITLAGPFGSASVSLDLRADAAAVQANTINAVSQQTGVSAVVAEDGRGIILSAVGKVSVSDLTSHGLATVSSRSAPIVSFMPLKDDGSALRDSIVLRPMELASTTLVGRVNDSIDTVALALAEVGSLGAIVERRSDEIASRMLNIDTSVAGLNDLDVAAAVTRLQSLLMSQQASQQTFVKIVGTSLFDYL